MTTLVLLDDPILAVELAARLGCEQQGPHPHLFVGERFSLLCLEGGVIRPALFPPGSEREWPWLPERLRLELAEGGKALFEHLRERVQGGEIGEVWVATRPDAGGDSQARWLLLMAGGARLPLRRLWFRERHPEGLEEALAAPLSERQERNRSVAAEGRAWLETLWPHHLARHLEPALKRRLPLHLSHLLLLAAARRQGGPSSGRGGEGRPPVRLWAELEGTRVLWQPTSGREAGGAQEVLQRLGALGGARGIVMRVQVEQRREPPPQPPGLFELQQRAWEELGFPPQRTLQVARELFHRYGALSWPETDGRFWATEQVVTFPERLRAWTDSPWGPLCNALLELERPGLDAPSVRDAQDGEHHAILPAACSAGQRAAMSPEAQALLNLVFQRFLASLLPPAREEHRFAAILLGGETFVARSRTLLDPGWRRLEGPDGARWEQAPGEEVPADWSKGRSLLLSRAWLEEPPLPAAPSPLLELLKVLEPRGSSGTGKKGPRAGACGVGLPGQRLAWLEELVAWGALTEREGRLELSSLGEGILEGVPPALLRGEVVARWEEELLRLGRGEGRLESFQRALGKGLVTELSVPPPPRTVQKPERRPRPAGRPGPQSRSGRDRGGAFPGLTLGGLLEEALKKKP